MNGKVIDRHLIAIVDGNVRHREQLAEVLMPFYAISAYGDVTNALMGMGVTAPGLVLVGEYVPPSGGVNFLRAMRQERNLGHTPAIFISDNGDLDTLQAAVAAGANDCLLKPYRRSTLVRGVSAQLNAKVERKWKLLPPALRDALEGAAGIFNSIADVIDSGSPFQYLAVAESCAALVQLAADHRSQTILEAIREHDNYTFVHSLRVAILLTRFGAAIGLPKQLLQLLAAGGLLHDVGKMAIRHPAIGKRDDLTLAEEEIVRAHVSASIEFLRGAEGVPKGVITIAAQHHERLDGSGYPAGLKGAELNDLARMTAIVDAFVTLTDHRLHHVDIGAGRALAVMAEEMGPLFDRDLLARFRELMMDAVQPSAK